MNAHLERSPEIEAAIAAGRPVVALESTLIAHGMPWPQSLETAHALEAAVRELGAVPATIAIVAAMAGIRVFATGGIGGVHRGAATSFDISADLTELARTPVAVVCAGAKAILDLGLTLEYLETHGVPVVGFRTAQLPGFWVRDSGYRLDVALDAPEDIARVMRAQWELGFAGGLVVANPIPAACELPRERVEQAIATALREAQEAGVTGKAITPFLLERVNAITGGESLAANVALVLDNARLAARIAVAYQALDREPRR